MRDEPTPDILLERAVELWCRMLHRPKFDNGDSSLTGVMTQGLAAQNREHDRAQIADYAATIERFRVALTERLKFLRDHEGQETGEQGRYGPERHYFSRSLDTDYNPDRNLADAAEKAGLPISAFSWKTNVSFYGNECVTISAGYGAPHKNHFPLPDGRWLICELQGREMPKVIEAVVDGRLTDFDIEEAHP